MARAGVPTVASQIKTPTSTHEDAVQFLALLSGLRISHCHELQQRSQIWLGSHVAVAVV